MSQAPCYILAYDAVSKDLTRLEDKAQCLHGLQKLMRFMSNEMPTSYGQTCREYELTLKRISFLKGQLKKIFEDRNNAVEVLRHLADSLALRRLVWMVDEPSILS